MLIAALRDLQFRSRRFAITVVGTSLVFSLTLVLAGLSAAFGVEVDDTVRSLPLDGWIVDASSSGPLLAAAPLPGGTIDEVRALPGVVDAGGMAMGRQTVDLGGLEDVILLAAEPGRPGMPAADSGRAPTASGEILASSRLGLDIGDELALGERGYEVVGILDDASVLAGVSTVVLTLADGQELIFAGLDAATSIAYTGSPDALPDGLALAAPDDAVAELTRPIESAVSAVTLVSVLLWIIAGLIIGSVVYLSVLERESDFAVFKATGWSDRSLLGGVALQALVLALLAAAIGMVLGTLLAPVFPMRVEISPTAYLALPLLAVAVGLLASVAGLRRITAVDPAAAFG